MKFPRIVIEKFLSIEQAELSMSDRGLVVIQGENESNTSAESNGAGKSTVPDALCWAAYGVTARGVSGDAVINDAFGKGTRVVFDVVEGDVHHVVSRHRKHKDHKNSLRLERIMPDGTVLDLTKGTDKLTQDEVDKVLGCSYDVFRSTVYMGQEQMPDLPGMTDKQLKVVVEEAAGVTLLEDAYKEANSRVTAQKKLVEDLERVVETTRQRWDDSTRVVQDLRDGKTKFDTDNHNEIVAQTELAKLLAVDFKKFDAKIKAAGKEEIEKELAALKAQIDGVAAERRQEVVLANEVNKANRDVGVIRAEVNRLKSVLDREKLAEKNIRDRVGQPCDECGKPYCEHDLEAAGIRQALKVTHAENELKTATDALKRLDSELTIASQKLSDHRASMTDISAATALYDDLSSSLSAIRETETNRDVILGRVKGCKTQIEAIKARKNPFDAKIAKAEAETEKLKEAMSDASKKLIEAQTTLRRAETIAKVFSPAGVRARILDEVTPFLNDQTAKYLATLTDGNSEATWSTLVKTAKGELREKFSIEVKDADGASSFAGLSGGEKRKVRIASALALHDLVARRATKPIDLFVGDEIDDALDEAGLERLTMILQEKAKERGSVFVISHNELRDWIPNAITVVKAGRGKSTIKEDA